jgi:hypothetical protein
MKSKRIICSALAMSLILGSSMPAFAADKSNKKLNTTTSATKVLNGKTHKTKEISSPEFTLDRADEPDWHYNSDMYNDWVTTHLSQGAVGAIATLLCGEFGGKAANYLMAASGLSTLFVSENTTDFYETVDYYWTDSGDAEYPYYVKQVITYYSDPDRTKYVTRTTRYYDSDMPY